MKKLGIIQTRGLGDIIIALPIAGYYKDQGYEIHWPILEQWVEQMQSFAPWINWYPVKPNTNEFFYEIPLGILQKKNIKEILCLYQSLTNHPEFQAETFFQHTKFDQYKYFKAGVPFLQKWNLSKYITRDQDREKQLFDQLITNDHYVVIHLQGSDHQADFDRTIIPSNWQQIEISSQTANLFDWLMILEKAECVILVDSVFANLVDQLQLNEDCYFIPRSHIQLTPVQGQNWIWLQNKNLPKNTKIFR